MKHLTLTRLSIFAIGLFSLGTAVLLAQGNRRGVEKGTLGTTHVTIEYGRPSLNGRDPLKMIKPGQVWRLGSSAPTTINTDQDLRFGKTRVPKGRHILLAQMTEPGRWVLLVSKKSADQYDPSAKIAEVPMKFSSEKNSVEEMTIKLASHQNEGDIEVAWGTSRLTASFTAAE